MSQRRNHKPSMKKATCNKCLAEAHAVPGKAHRRCPGQPGQAIQAKHKGVAPVLRGRWE